MPRTYRAILRGDRVEWIDPPPAHSHAAQVQITVLEETPDLSLQDRGLIMALILEELSHLGALGSISDPVRWQREVRQDRQLHEREP